MSGESGLCELVLLLENWFEKLENGREVNVYMVLDIIEIIRLVR